MKFLDVSVTVFFSLKNESIMGLKKRVPLETLDFQRQYAMRLRKEIDA